MSVKQISFHVIRIRCVTITWDHTTAPAVLGTLEMVKRVSVIVKFLLIEWYYFLVVLSIIVLRFFLQKDGKKKKQNKTKPTNNEIMFRPFGNIMTPLSRNGFMPC